MSRGSTLSRFDWTRHAVRAALASAVVVAAVAGTVVLQSPATPPSAVDPAEPVTDSAPQLTMAGPPPVSPSVVSTAPSEPPSVEAPVPSEVIPPPEGQPPWHTIHQGAGHRQSVDSQSHGAISISRRFRDDTRTPPRGD